MTAIARAFVAVVPPADVLDAIEEHLRPVPFARWRESRRAQWHLTLEFLGRVDDADGEVDRLATLAAGAPAFPARLGGAGAFPDERRARVVWIGVSDGAHELRGLATRLRRLDAEPFHPHLTVARASRPRDASALVAGLDAPAVGPVWSIDSVELVASDTHSSGARYTTVAHLALGGRRDPDPRS